jgi:hypothetical protein
MDEKQMRTNWNEAKAGFELMKPWIKDQFEIDGDTVQIEEILREVVDSVLPWSAEISKEIISTEKTYGFQFSREFMFRRAYKNDEQKRALEGLALQKLGKHHDAFIEWRNIGHCIIFWNPVQS